MNKGKLSCCGRKVDRWRENRKWRLLVKGKNVKRRKHHDIKEEKMKKSEPVKEERRKKNMEETEDDDEGRKGDRKDKMLMKKGRKWKTRK